MSGHWLATIYIQLISAAFEVSIRISNPQWPGFVDSGSPSGNGQTLMYGDKGVEVVGYTMEQST